MQENTNTSSKNYATSWQKDIDRSLVELFNGVGFLIIAMGIAVGDLLKWSYRHYVKAILLASGLHGGIYFSVNNDYHLRLWSYLDFESFWWVRSQNIFELDNTYHFFGIYVFLFLPILFVMGLRSLYIRSIEEKIFKLARLKNANEEFPRVLKRSINKRIKQTILLIDPKGLGVLDFESKKDQLEGLFKLGIIENIERSKNDQSKIEIIFSQMIIPEFVSHKQAHPSDIKHNHFVVGQTKEGVLTQDITDLPHMLIAGMTGSGKSVFFKQVLLSLLKSTPKTKMYLVDLKQGLEMTDFKDAPNVEIVKDIKSAVKLLSDIKAEMEKRLNYLGEVNRKNIIPEKDNMPRIIVGIDECSVLYMKKNKGSHEYDLHIRATEITDDIAKLSRAAGIHLILATQKVTKETINTSIQDNIAGKVCFKMSGNSASVLVLGNKKAEELPKIKGRAIWHLGQDYIEFQAPFVSEQDIKAECKTLALETERSKEQIQEESSGEKFEEVITEKSGTDNNKIQALFGEKKGENNENK